MYRLSKNHKLLLLVLMVCMGVPIFIQPVRASVDPGGDRPPPYITCWAQVCAYKGWILWWPCVD